MFYHSSRGEHLYIYIIGLFYFSENYRIAPATFVPDPRYAFSYTIFARRPSSQIERQLLAQYNMEVVYRLFCCYDLLLEIVDQKVPQQRSRLERKGAIVSERKEAEGRPGQILAELQCVGR